MTVEAEKRALAEVLDGHPEFERILARLVAGDDVAAGNLWGSAQSLVVATLARRSPRAIVVVTSSEAEALGLVEDLEAFGTESVLLPARGGSVGGGDSESIRGRLRVAQQLAGPPDRRPRLLVASQLSLLQPLPNAEDVAGQFLHLQIKQRLDVEDLLARLVAAGYRREPLAEVPGEVSLRGDILDVFAFAADTPLRVELFDDEVESLRTFDPATQRSVEKLDRASVCLAADAGGVEDGRGASPLELFSANALVVEAEPLRLEDVRHGLAVRSSTHARALDQFLGAVRERVVLRLQSLPSNQIDLDGRSVQALGVGLPAAPGALASVAEHVARVVVMCRDEGERHRFEHFLAEHPPIANLELAIGTVQRGFRLNSAGLVVCCHHEIAGVAGARKQREAKPQHRVRAIESFFELRVGDLVVHAVHGLARYLGLVRMARSGGEEEHLHLEFDGGVGLYVPACRIDLVQRYVGTGNKAPGLDKIGSSSFKRRKEKVERALVDLASDLLEVQAKREMRKRDPWHGDDALVKEFEDAFPYEDTPDQATSSTEIAKELAGEKPMDRLLCGDVGFGKTEVAMRAAFRVVAGGGQVAVLVPTTVLAEQHWENFRARTAGFPVEVAVLSRLQNKGAKKTLADVAAGKVDILIGTHRILSKDVTFRNLGLVVVDEEQRFGVKHKEHFKTLRAGVDLLTLSATPIPRTLHMSLSGVRDISALTVPPVGRQDVDTRIASRDDLPLIREAILREKSRGGQCFVLHNRVASIGTFTEQLRQLVPEARFDFGHGQMAPRVLDAVMHRFSRGELDVLVATTIIENGIDIPSAGTILIDDAHMFGLAELHQLRGRVGRAQQKSWCYLLVDPTKPMRGIAKERLKALEELSHLGAGFQISMKDLEIRGAGNLLGPEQSGHIAAIGYDMYCRLLAQTVERLRTGGLPTSPDDVSRELVSAADEVARGVELELGVRAYLPDQWIPSPETRLEVLRLLDTIHDTARAVEVEAELADRFGRLPSEAKLLVRLFRLRSALQPLSVTRVAWRDDCFLLEFGDRVALQGALAHLHVEIRPLRTGVALLMVPPDVKKPEAGLAYLERLLGLEPAR
ncbi:MAG: transcription-repair coupling factor [Planctomycetota bacterium]